MGWKGSTQRADAGSAGLLRPEPGPPLEPEPPECDEPAEQGRGDATTAEAVEMWRGARARRTREAAPDVLVIGAVAAR